MLKYHSVNNMAKIKNIISHQFFDEEGNELEILKQSQKRKITIVSKPASNFYKPNRDKRMIDESLPNIGDEFNFNDDQQNLSKLSKLLISNKSGKEEFNTQILVSYVEDLESIHDNLQKDLVSAKNGELQRIGKEYLINDYERVYRANISKVYSSIVGESNVLPEMRKFIDQKKNYYKSLEICRNYNVFQDKYNEISSSLFKGNKPVNN